MGHDVLKKLDRYFLLDCVAQGGMAEIFRACMASTDGANRLLIIKRILSGYGKNAEFQKMFKSEIKVMMAFNHPNIVQLYDYGEAREQPYIAMEYVDGRNLRQFISKFAENGEAMPVELAVLTIEQAALGLHYAHTFKDKISGEEMALVHRDISPQNLIISYDGAVKVIDFGIAKAEVNGEATRVGIIKGKPSYLSPEQIAGQVLDARSDVFALGIVLWEALTGKKLFSVPSGENEFAVLKLIENVQNHAKPPSQQNPAIPKDLDLIVMRALSKDRDKRFQSAEELQRALRKFLNVHFPDIGSSELSTFAKTLFKNEIVEDRKNLQRLMGRAESLLGTGGGHSLVTAHTTLPHLAEGTYTFIDPHTKAQKATGADDRFDSKSFGEIKIEIDKKPDLAGKERKRPRPPRLETISKSTMKRPMSLDDLESRERSTRSTGRLLRVLVASVAVMVGATFVIPKIQSWKAVFVQSGGQETAVSSTPEAKTNSTSDMKESAGGLTIVLDLKINPSAAGARIVLAGRPLSENQLRTSVPLDQPLLLTIEKPRYRTVQREFVLSSKQYAGLDQAAMDIALEPVQFGLLTLQSTPSADAVIRSLDFPNEPATVIKSPVENQRMPAGRYSIRLENTVLGMGKTVSPVVIEENRTLRIDERLEIKP